MDQTASVNRHDPHEITPECPVSCLRAVLSWKTLSVLASAPEAPFDPPETVGDILRLHQERRLRQISGLGRRRIGEIGVGLVYAGFSTERSRPRNPEPT
jgi:hypothetical protein